MNLRHLNLRYAAVNIGFMLLVSGSLGFAYNYLSQSGFDAGTIGTTMSLVSLGGVFLGPAAGDLVDRSSKITQKMFISGSMIVVAVLSILLLLIPSGSPLILPVIILAFMSSTVGMPLLNSMAFIYEKAGGVINYGLCRGLGSAAYAIGSNIVGLLWGQFGRNTLPYWVVLGAVLTFIAINLMPDAPKESSTCDDANDKDATRKESSTMLAFFGKYPSMVIVILSLVLVYFCHNIVNTYMGAILAEFVPTDQVESVQGTALFIQAMVELPTMFGFALIMKRLSIDRIMAIAMVFYSIKHVLVLFCSSVPMFYAAMVLQMLSFAAITPATVYFVAEHIHEEDLNKGQAVFATTNTVGGLLASFVGGWLFQLLSVHIGLSIGVVASIAGTILMILGTRRLAH